MVEFRCQSGPLSIVVLAETAEDAAREAILWWGPRSTRYRFDRLGADHRRSLDATIQVSEVDSTETIRLSTFELIAQAEGRSPETAWNEALDQLVGQNN